MVGHKIPFSYFLALNIFLKIDSSVSWKVWCQSNYFDFENSVFHYFRLIFANYPVKFFNVQIQLIFPPWNYFLDYSLNILLFSFSFSIVLIIKLVFLLYLPFPLLFDTFYFFMSFSFSWSFSYVSSVPFIILSVDPILP